MESNQTYCTSSPSQSRLNDFYSSVDVIQQLLSPHVDLCGNVKVSVLVLLTLFEHPVSQSHIVGIQLDSVTDATQEVYF